jgi:hypothetical protein
MPNAMLPAPSAIFAREKKTKKKGGRRAWNTSGFTPVEWRGPMGECPFCGGHVRIGQHRHGPLQTLSERLLVHARDCRCASKNCPSPGVIFRPIEEQRLRLKLCGYGIDVVYLVIERYFGGMSLPAIHQLLTEKYGIQISQTHVANLLRLGLALVRCRDVSNEKLKARLRAQGGIVLSADAVNFDETSAPLYVLRDVLSAEVLSARRLDLRGAAQVIPLFEEVRQLDVPVLGIITDKEPAFLEAASEVFPGSPHQFCQPHYLMNLAKPMDCHLQQVGRGVRTVVREVRALEKAILKQQDDPGTKPPLDEHQAEADEEVGSMEAVLESQDHQDEKQQGGAVEDVAPAEVPGGKETCKEADAERKVVLQLCRVVAAVGKSRGDSLLDPTPLKRYEKLESVKQAAEKAEKRAKQQAAEKAEKRAKQQASEKAEERVKQGAEKADKREGGPWPLITKLLTALAVLESYAEQASFLLRQVSVLNAIAYILGQKKSSGATVEASLQTYLDELSGTVSEEDKKSGWSAFVCHVVAVTARFKKGLFHCYDNPLLPSNNNATEGFFGALKRFSRRITGRQSTSGGPIETCAEFFVEAFSLFRSSDHPELLAILSEISVEELDNARDEFKKLAQPAKNKRSIARDTDLALKRILEEWTNPPDSS